MRRFGPCHPSHTEKPKLSVGPETAQQGGLSTRCAAGSRAGRHTPEGRQPESPLALGTGQTHTHTEKSASFCTFD